MTDLFLAFRSASDAIAGERKLLDACVDTQTIDAPKAIPGGCGICLRVNSADIGKVRLLLGKTIQGVYSENENGTPLPLDLQ